MNEVIYGSLLCFCLQIIFDLLYCYNLSLENFCECTFLIFFDLPHVPLSMCTVYSSIQLEKGVCHHFLKPLTIVRLGGSGFFAIQSPDASGGTGGRTGYILYFKKLQYELQQRKQWYPNRWIAHMSLLSAQRGLAIVKARQYLLSFQKQSEPGVGSGDDCCVVLVASKHMLEQRETLDLGLINIGISRFERIC